MAYQMAPITITLCDLKDDFSILKPFEIPYLEK